MKHRYLFLTLLFSAFLSLSASAQSTDYETHWNKVSHYIEDYLPLSAASALDSIENQALAEGNQMQLLKALLFRQKIMMLTEENNAKEAYIRFAKQKVTVLDTVQAALLHTELARCYASIWKDSRWVIERNTYIEGNLDSTEMRYWGEGNFREAIDAHLAEALRPTAQLKRAPMQDFLMLFENETMPDIVNIQYEPTLFDFVFHRVATYYKSVASGDDIPSEWNTDDWWLPAEGFAAANLAEGDNAVLRLLRIYQELIANNLDNGNEEALIYNDFNRFRFVNAILQDDNAYQKALCQLEKAHEAHPLSADIALERADNLAKQYMRSSNPNENSDNYYQASEICRGILNKFPDSDAAEGCVELLDYLDATQLDVSLNNVQLANEAIPLVLRYRNGKRAYFKMVKVSEEEFENTRRWDNAQKRKLMAKTSAVEHRVNLPKEEDLLWHSTLVALPPVEPGLYCLLVTPERNTQDENKILMLGVQVSNLAFITDEENTLITIDRKTGKPLEGVTVECLRTGFRKGIREERVVSRKKSDAEGRVRFGRGVNNYFHVRLRHGDDVLYTLEDLDFSTGYGYYFTIDPGYTTATLFTDRSIYRPGQTVYYHGVVTRTKNNKETLVSHQKQKVSFRDTNKGIGSQTVWTDNYGSFSGSFVIPEDGPKGVYKLSIDLGFVCCYLRVEEYKRPTFEVGFDKPKEQYKLNQEVAVEGSVKAYAGFGLDDVECRYRVERTTSFPWRCYGQTYPYVDDEQIAQGTTRTDGDGKFHINFMLKPAAKIEPELQPVFIYTVEVTATNAQGETHEEKFSFSAGYNEVAISSNLPSLLEKTEGGNYHIEVLNMSGEPAQSRVSQKLYRYEESDRIDYFETMHNNVNLDRKIISDEELARLFPNYDFYPNDAKTLVSETEYKVDGKRHIDDFLQLQPGRYLLELQSLDDTLATLTEQFIVSDRKTGKMPVTKLYWSQVDRTTAQPGDTIHITLGSSAKEVGTWLKLVHDDEEVRMDQWVEVSEGLVTLSYVVTESDRGMLCLLVGSYKENCSRIERYCVDVPYDNFDLEVELASVRDKLSPGAEETWNLTVRDLSGKPVKSAILTGMYDASLDAFREHNWSLNLKPYSYYTSAFNANPTTYFSNESTGGISYGYQVQLFNFSLPSDAPFFDMIYVRRSHSQRGVYYESLGSWSKADGKGPRGRLKGKITDDTEEAVPFANIIIEKSGTQIAGCSSDFDGFYDINPIPPGTYDLKASCIGYKPYILKSIVIPSNKITYYDIKMITGAISLSEVCVVDYEIPLVSKDNTRSGASITAEEIAKLPNRSAEGVAAQVGGVFSSDGEVGSIRGSGSNYEYIWPGHKNSQEVEQQEQERMMMERFLAAPRENFNETAFFNYLKTDKDGSASFSFTMPDALTRWHFMALAYNRERQTGFKEYSFTTSKPVMIMADMPRYMYDSDTLWFVANVINTGDETVAPKAKLEIFDAATMEPINLLLSNAIVPMEEIVPGRSMQVRWKVAARPGLDLLSFRFIAYAGEYSDAEQHLLPVLCSEVFMTETLPFIVQADTVQTFDIKSIVNPKDNEREESLTLNLSTNPVWYAVQPLPYLDGISTYCAENAFYVFYANTLSAYISDHIPQLMAYIRKWKVETPDALLSKLEKDQELKAILLKETPWVMQAKNVAQQRSRLSVLFDALRLPLQQTKALNVMSKQQKDSGGWSWMEMMPESPFITTRILMGFGKLKEMGALSSLNNSNASKAEGIVKKAVRVVEKEVSDTYQKAKQSKIEPVLNTTLVDELYALSFFDQETLTLTIEQAKTYYLGLMEKNWKTYNFDRQAKMALVLYRNGKTDAAKLITQSLKERAQQNDEVGMYWKKDYFTFESDVAIHANIMAAFAEIEQEDALLDRMRLWLLSKKRFDRWENSASTLEATYALLLRGSDWFDEGKEVTLRFGNTPIDTEGGVAGTGFIQRRWNANEVTQDMRQLTVNNPTNHLVWGGLFRQYFVPIDEVKSNESGFTIKRELFVETVTDKGKKLVPVGTALRQAQGPEGAAVVEPVETPLKVGDKVTVKITFTSQQDMSFVFVKDLRAAGFEPIEQVSHYEYNDRMSYYQSNTDTDMEFFIEFLPKGTHQLEYSMFVTKEGYLNNGYALIQCQYAPEFSAYSDGMRIRVGE